MNKPAQILTRDVVNHATNSYRVVASTPDNEEREFEYSLTLSPAANHKRAAIWMLEALGCKAAGVSMQSAFDTGGTLWEVA